MRKCIRIDDSFEKYFNVGRIYKYTIIDGVIPRPYEVISNNGIYRYSKIHFDKYFIDVQKQREDKLNRILKQIT